MIPQKENDWILITKENSFGSAYREEFDFARIPMKVDDNPNSIERFTMTFTPSEDEALLSKSWENKIAEIELVNSNENMK